MSIKIVNSSCQRRNKALSAPPGSNADDMAPPAPGDNNTETQNPMPVETPVPDLDSGVDTDSGPLSDPSSDITEDPDYYEVDEPVSILGPGPSNGSTPHYKLCILWDTWTPQVKSRAISDVISIQRLTIVNRVAFVIATDPELVPALRAIGVTTTDNFVRPHLTRVYLTGDGVEEELLPLSLSDRLDALSTESEIDYVNINIQHIKPQEDIDNTYRADAYTGFVLPTFSKRIPETMPIDRPAPKGAQTVMWSPYL